MSIDKYDDIIDSRDVIKRIAELEAEIEADDEELEESESARESTLTDEREELKALQALQEAAEGYSDWSHGATLIRDSYFETYAQELADDCGMLVAGATWPNNCIDWERAARELQMDYSGVEFDGITYWIR